MEKPRRCNGPTTHVVVNTDRTMFSYGVKPRIWAADSLEHAEEIVKYVAWVTGFCKSDELHIAIFEDEYPNSENEGPGS